MKEIIESVNEKIRPMDGFSCSNCPFSHWIAGKTDYSGDSENTFVETRKEVLNCYCTKRHQLTYDSQNTGSSFGKTVIFYTHIVKCQERILSSNQF